MTVLESAVKAARLYQSSSGCRLRDQQKLYASMMRKCRAVAKARDMSENDAFEQIAREAERQGALIPMPGKDI